MGGEVLRHFAPEVEPVRRVRANEALHLGGGPFGGPNEGVVGRGLRDLETPAKLDFIPEMPEPTGEDRQDRRLRAPRPTSIAARRCSSPRTTPSTSGVRGPAMASASVKQLAKWENVRNTSRISAW